jgi:hypothetical protein
MRKLLFLSLILLIVQISEAQNNMGIGTTFPNSNALLELQNNGNPLGLLLPRQDTGTFVAIGPAEAGLMVYNPGDNRVYTWNGSNWISSTSIWGNNGPNIYNLNAGSVGIGTNAPDPAYALDVSGNISIGGITAGQGFGGGFNTVFGFNALPINTGNTNAAFGQNAMAANTSGFDNAAFGTNAMIANDDGGGNTAIGTRALEGNVSGNNNIALGHIAGSANVDGFDNIFIGYFSNASAGNLNNAIAIGTGATVTASNRMVLGSPGTNIQFSGELRPNDNPGTAGQVLTSAGPGATPTWNTLSSVSGSGIINRITYWNTASTIADASNLGWDNTNERLGIGWALPETPLHIHRAAALDVFAKFTNTVSFVGAGNGIEMGLTSGNEAIFRNYENTPIRFYTNGLERVTLEGGGFVGIGTTTPAITFHVEGSDNGVGPANSGTVATGSMRITDASSVPAFDFGIADDAFEGGWLQVHNPGNQSINYPLLLNPNGGNVGIGRTDPWAPLQFATTIANRKIVLWQNTNNEHEFYGFGINSGTLRYQVPGTVDRHVFYAGTSAITSTELMRIQGNGRVGIGTASPLGALHIENTDWNSNPVYLGSSGTVGSSIRFQNSSAGARIYDIIGSTGTGASLGAGNFAVWDNTAGAYRFAIDPAGRVEVFNTTDASGAAGSGAFEVANALRMDANEIITNTNAPLYLQNDNNGDLIVDANTFMVDASADKVGIGTGSPSSWGKIHVAGGTYAVDGTTSEGMKWVSGNTLQADMFRWGNSSNALYVTNNGLLNLTGVYLNVGATSWTSSSDSRLKENITESSYGLNEILQLSVKEYNYRTTENKQKRIGFLAQDVYQVIPEIVDKGDNGPFRGDGNAELSAQQGFEPWGIRYTELVPVLVKAIQELKAENEELKSRIEVLESEK